jgi:hypothetical protein
MLETANRAIEANQALEARTKLEEDGKKLLEVVALPKTVVAEESADHAPAVNEESWASSGSSSATHSETALHASIQACLDSMDMS